MPIRPPAHARRARLRPLPLLRIALAATGVLSLAGACTTRQIVVDDDDGGQAAVGTPSGPCEPLSQALCYSGPEPTLGVGTCVAGVATCNEDGGGWGPCIGEVLPALEVCATQGDDDCDGAVNEDGPDCGCVPGTEVGCYSAPPSTQGVGICQGGVQTCNAEGSGYGPCHGQVVPGAEDCATAADEDCDGLTPPCGGAAPIIDLRADNNRNGTVELTGASEDASEDSWNHTHGAVFLANIDDDEEVCPTNVSDAQLAACHDAADEVVNGPDDLLDLARLKTVPWPDAPADASGAVAVDSASAQRVRLFKRTGSNFSVYTPGTPLTATELQQGVELAIEARDIVRDAAVWNGSVDLTLSVNAGTVDGVPLGQGTDRVRMKVAPVLFRHHLDETEIYYVTNLSQSSSQVFRNDLAEAAVAGGVPYVWNVYEGDQWTQDFFETAYASMPSPGGQQVMHVNFRSANYTGQLREAGRTVYTAMRGADRAGVTVYDPSHPNYMDSLNSFGNLETIPPHTHAGKSWPMGRVLRGSHPELYTDPVFDKMIASQGVQDLVYVDTSWLLVGHVDETLSFIETDSARGWAMLYNDATLAKTMLEDLRDAGYGNRQMFVGKSWSSGGSAQTTVNAVLNDPDVMDESAWAAVKVDEQLGVMRAQTGITNAEMVPVPFLHMEASGYSLAYQPGTVNGIYLAGDRFAPPDPHGPVVNNQDVFKVQLEQALGEHGVNVSWVENWDLYHRLSGEVHCGTNATRVIPDDVRWWEMAK